MTRLALAVVLAAACGQSDKSDAPAPPPARFAQGTIDAAACNALVPAALKDKIVFEQRAIPIKRGRASVTTYTVAAPRGWTQEMDAFGDLKADDRGGFFSSMHVGTNCDGSCTPKAWEQVADKATFQPILKDATVIKDVKGAGTRTVIAEGLTNTKTTEIATAWWTAGADHYFTCRATLDPAVKDAAPAFERACSAMASDGAD